LLENSQAAGRLAASQEGFSFMELLLLQCEHFKHKEVFYLLEYKVG
jgi:hypothetical protein